MSRTIDFSERTFFEHVSLAARETVYSAAFAWVLGEHSPLPLEQRLKVVAQLCGSETAGARSCVATTEWKKVDILLTIARNGEPQHILIENKLKSNEGDGQLSAYDELATQLSGEVRKLFLTLAGDAPGSPNGWAPVSYSTFLEALRSQPGSEDRYIADLCAALSRLVAVANAARSGQEEVAAAAFGDLNTTELSPINKYVEDMRLEKIVQRIWITGLAGCIDVPPPWRQGLGETHGQALLNIEVELQDEPGYMIGLQLQNRNLKAFCAPSPYPPRASDDQHRQVEPILLKLRAALALGEGVRPSSRRTRGFRSYNVATLPSGRSHEEWAPIVRKQLERLQAAFSAVRPPSNVEVVIDTED